MRCKLVSALAASAAFVPCLAQAEGLSYSYADLAYVSTDIDRFDEDVDGFALRGSIEVVDKLFVFANYADQGTTVFGNDLDVETYAIGVGYAWPVGQALDLYGKVGYVSAEADVGGFGNADDDGYSLGVGLRGRAITIDQLELEGSLNYVDLSDSGDDTTLGLGARWYFTKQFAVGVEGEFGDDANTYGVGVRWDFGS
jgi:hypothetical protein